MLHMCLEAYGVGRGLGPGLRRREGAHNIEGSEEGREEADPRFFGTLLMYACFETRAKPHEGGCAAGAWPGSI